LGFPLELLGHRPQPLDLCPGLRPLLVRLRPFCCCRCGQASWNPPVASCSACSVAAASVAARFGWRSSVVGGRSRGNCAPVVVVVLTLPAAGWVVGTVEGVVATGVGPTVGVGIVGGAAVVPAGIVGAAVATTGGAILGGAMTGPYGAVTPCVPAAAVVLLLRSSSPPDSSLSWCLK
jgi:hypothetical protein